ncbi:hypothetical protein CBM2589_B10050 [Cupriavidus taiwanensis]|uniref:Uncharacterized protein n=1 Tax=Cupriavidus taiwanensis TaxID=164546 RepID=A0A975ZV37_9BURK|nr:hypothetical protein CBM2589_B10050 [Cupriavidus taiwanensis]
MLQRGAQCGALACFVATVWPSLRCRGNQSDDRPCNVASTFGMQQSNSIVFRHIVHIACERPSLLVGRRYCEDDAFISVSGSSMG